VNVPEAKTVLYVEDNRANVLLVQAIFESSPTVQLLTATHGSSGLDLARRQVPDLILLDLNLPDMDGEEFLKKLRAAPATAEIPVVIISADATSKQLNHYRQLGVQDYITKPFDLSLFEEVVGQYLGA
jgi:CheY-like chemotaxis protein